MRSPLPELYGKLVCLFGGVGILAAIFFHPGMLCVFGLALFVILIFFNSLEQGVQQGLQAKERNRNRKRGRRYR